MTYRPPQTIRDHPGVEECVSGEAEGFDYKHHVFLKPDWRFKRGRMADCRTGNFNTVRDFVSAQPVNVKGKGNEN